MTSRCTRETSVSRQNDPRIAVRDRPSCDGAGSSVGHVVDHWSGLSRDIVERFIDVTCMDRSMSRSARRGCRADLVGLDSWMQRMRGYTLVSGRPADLRVYLEERGATGVDARLLGRLLTSMRDFYRYLNEFGYRDDNAAKRLPLAVPQPASEVPVPGTMRLSGADG